LLFLLPGLSGLPIQFILFSALGLIAGALIGMTIHEFAHNYVGHLMGDPVPAREGRLTLDPRVHIYWPGFIMFVLIGFGILGMAPIAAHRMRNPRLGYLAAVAAGPFSNLLLAVVLAIIWRILSSIIAVPPEIFLLVNFLIMFNVLLFVFNLLPMYPLDGWHIVLALLPPDLAYTWQRYAQTTQYIFLGLILLSFVPVLPIDPLRLLIGQPMNIIMNLLLG
jgi:Zn-dependent protease